MTSNWSCSLISLKDWLHTSQAVVEAWTPQVTNLLNDSDHPSDNTDLSRDKQWPHERRFGAIRDPWRPCLDPDSLCRMDLGFVTAPLIHSEVRHKGGCWTCIHHGVSSFVRSLTHMVVFSTAQFSGFFHHTSSFENTNVISATRSLNLDLKLNLGFFSCSRRTKANIFASPGAWHCFAVNFNMTIFRRVYLYLKHSDTICICLAMQNPYPVSIFQF